MRENDGGLFLCGIALINRDGTFAPQKRGDVVRDGLGVLPDRFARKNDGDARGSETSVLSRPRHAAGDVARRDRKLTLDRLRQHVGEILGRGVVKDRVQLLAVVVLDVGVEARKRKSAVQKAFQPLDRPTHGSDQHADEKERGQKLHVLGKTAALPVGGEDAHERRDQRRGNERQ